MEPAAGRDRRPPMRGRSSLLPVLALALVVFDSVATHAHLTLGHAVEGNAVVAAMIERWGTEAGLVIRTLQASVLVLALSWLARRSRLAQQGLAGVTLVMLGVAVYHLAGPALLM